MLKRKGSPNTKSTFISTRRKTSLVIKLLAPRLPTQCKDQKLGCGSQPQLTKLSSQIWMRMMTSRIWPTESSIRVRLLGYPRRTSWPHHKLPSWKTQERPKTQNNRKKTKQMTRRSASTAQEPVMTTLGSWMQMSRLVLRPLEQLMKWADKALRLWKSGQISTLLTNTTNPQTSRWPSLQLSRRSSQWLWQMPIVYWRAQQTNSEVKNDRVTTIIGLVNILTWKNEICKELY